MTDENKYKQLEQAIINTAQEYLEEAQLQEKNKGDKDYDIRSAEEFNMTIDDYLNWQFALASDRCMTLCDLRVFQGNGLSDEAIKKLEVIHKQVCGLSRRKDKVESFYIDPSDNRKQ